MVIRSWNIFHGNTKPTGRTRDLPEMVRLAVADEPAIVCLQEVPVFALRELGAWSGMASFGAVGRRPLLPAKLAGRITDLYPGLLRSGIEGQANAMLVDPALLPTDHRVLALNPRRVRERESERLRLPWRARVAWARERRVCHAVRVTLPGGRAAVAANLHATKYAADRRLADAELLRAATFADALARPDDAVVLAGDFNVAVVASPTLRMLASREWGFSAAGEGVDHVLVRGLRVVHEETRWPDDRRRVSSRLLSDHTPVEVDVE